MKTSDLDKLTSLSSININNSKLILTPTSKQHVIITVVINFKGIIAFVRLSANMDTISAVLLTDSPPARIMYGHKQDTDRYASPTSIEKKNSCVNNAPKKPTRVIKTSECAIKKFML